MGITTRSTRCLLCNEVIEDDNLPRHLRAIHEVIAGERTHVDVPLLDQPVPKPIKVAVRPPEDEKTAAIV